MISPDVNVLIYAFREDSDRHAAFKRWLENALNGAEPVLLFEPVLCAVLRIATHPAVFKPPAPRANAERFIDILITAPASVRTRPTDEHWPRFRSICQLADCRGNLIQDAYFAAMALEHGATWVTTDRDYARFPGLTWMHPLDHAVPLRNPSAPNRKQS